MSEQEENICPIHNQPLHACASDCSKVTKIENDLFLDSKKIIESLLNPEQMQFLEKERQIRELKFQSDGKIVFPHAEATSNDVLLWKAKEGVIDATCFNGILLVIYNAEIKIPDGCKDLRTVSSHGKLGNYAGVYDSEKNICFVDIRNTYNFLDGTFHPEWEQNIARHELRHGLVTAIDREHGAKTTQSSVRNIDGDKMNPEIHRQLAYLDELHSMYFDVLEGADGGRTSFVNIDSGIYSIIDSGNHQKVASDTEEGKLLAKELFYRLQAFILSKRMIEQDHDVSLQGIIDELSMAVGAVLGTERSLSAAYAKIKLFWEKLSTNEIFKNKLLKFVKTYKPDVLNNTPEISSELQAIFSINTEFLFPT
ncbi:MAG: hypothetical protein A2821_04060 [Candidatus Magasanikbacteria bacterium RIFCSPHIGHO2_01_FULL_41_23]|uniref:Uncharacterized protein n=1 Tax=Candidatus Magasanikbacteria bacterium RIFCSPLOWO2_01_FULL_40_15 TaxID=1798686 RepID=A0A1F6N317_9BACT|nr:MAG: hypothetical protein A2821_04060 [Candidatus Magasanikbacteria bacterium RIFCSPHIGHO2_01_FULL_41_23]OGH66991.1 MAG: hypothetical protein A3C66_00600 [Candidatus Magasanikbacteria bacterium RIFCSPHIGHO2_02_FULL_41_35]OGH74972.1 MAG: hypothetical protein A3F22_02735 [Candidatus Magasanikbacteria bacterium RIFCSPHIGHO2_12_FULL_41_16]OGH78274.1 MAG: hypothetical protein A2983_02370 [Candidatus Magasanikbacteria bacterium RIFCSPLOWO2_01_FULL_40_15]